MLEILTIRKTMRNTNYDERKIKWLKLGNLIWLVTETGFEVAVSFIIKWHEFYINKWHKGYLDNTIFIIIRS